MRRARTRTLLTERYVHDDGYPRIFVLLGVRLAIHAVHAGTTLQRQHRKQYAREEAEKRMGWVLLRTEIRPTDGESGAAEVRPDD